MMPLERAEAAVSLTRWNCPTCNIALESQFCPSCGERVLEARDLTLRGFLENVAKGITSVDARLIRSFRALITRPGALTVAYLQGQRKLYNAPLEVFFLANVLFFALHSLPGSRIFSATLE